MQLVGASSMFTFKSIDIAHAAIVVRMDKESFADGWVVLKHFARSEFLR